MSYDEQYPEDDEHAECRHEIHRLTAELERVKTERNRHSKDSVEFAAELASLKSRLPVNADGDVPNRNDKNWVYSHAKKKPEPIIVCRFMGIDDHWYFMNEDGDKIEAHQCHTTSESCRAAGGGE